MIAFALAALSIAPERILAVDGYVFAHQTKGRWRAADRRFARSHASAVFRPFGLGTAGGMARKTTFEFNENQNGTYLKNGELGSVLAGSIPHAPRKVRIEKPSAVYEALVRRFLATKGILLVQARVTRVMRVDLDGDGTDETLIEATSGEMAYRTLPGNYSLVLLRGLRDGRVVETSLEMSPSMDGGAMVVGRVRGVADLDGDGRMEVLTTIRGLDELGARLWAYRAGRATMLLENGIGV